MASEIEVPVLSFTIDESFVALLIFGFTNISSGFWLVVQAGYTASASIALQMLLIGLTIRFHPTHCLPNLK